jgi:hypothetical protein
VAIDPSLFVEGENSIAMEGFDTSGPFHNVALELTLTVPEPAAFGLYGIGGLSVFGFGWLRTTRRARQARHL